MEENKKEEVGIKQIRELSQSKLAKTIEFLDNVHQNNLEETKDRLKAVDLLVKIAGIGGRVKEEDDEEIIVPINIQPRI